MPTITFKAKPQFDKIDLKAKWHDPLGVQDVQLAVDYIAQLEATIDLLKEDCLRLRTELDNCKGEIR